MDALSDPVRQHTRARVVLGPATADQLESVLGAPPHTTPIDELPPGRGYARLGLGPVHRLQVPATPNPYDDATPDALCEAVLDLLPPRTTPADGETIPEQDQPQGEPEALPVEEEREQQAEPVPETPEQPEAAPVLTEEPVPNPVPVLTKET
jgi:hypothetical protein